MAVRLDFARKHQRVRVCRRSCGSAPYLNPVDHFWLQSGQRFRFNAIVANRGRNLVRIFQRDLQRPVRPARRLSPMYFNQRTLQGVRSTEQGLILGCKGFQSTHPLRGATRCVRIMGTITMKMTARKDTQT